jgi:hypothetical protein
MKKTIKQCCKERGLDEETAYAILCFIQREFYKQEKGEGGGT